MPPEVRLISMDAFSKCLFVACVLAGSRVEAQTTVRASVATDGGQGNDHSGGPGPRSSKITADGGCVVFTSSAGNLVPDDHNFRIDVFVRDLRKGTTERVSLGAGALEANGHCFCPSISADARFVAFESDASSLVLGDTNSARDIFVRDRWSGTTTLFPYTTLFRSRKSVV